MTRHVIDQPRDRNDEARMRQEQAMRDSMRDEGGRRGRMTPNARGT